MPTTEQLVAAIREGMAAQPLLAEKARAVADHQAALIRTRLPHITAADTGELMIHLAAAFSVAIAALSERGETPNSAVLVAASAIAMAGLDLYDDTTSHGADPATNQAAEAPLSTKENPS